MWILRPVAYTHLIVVSKTLLWDLMLSNQDFSERADKEIAGRLAYLTFVPVLYQDGECISRVCNYLIHLDICKNMDNTIPNNTQEAVSYTHLDVYKRQR